MRITKLSWAGIRVTADDAVLVVDPLGDAAPLAAFMGRPALELVPVAEPGSVSAALVTHEHPDHYDPVTLAEVLAEDAVVVCPPAIVDRVANDGLQAAPLAPGQSTRIGAVVVRAVRAVGGLGEEQVSYVVGENGARILHCGDTLWHGYWWEIAKFGPFECAFLPINGALVGYPSATGIPAALTPEQAAAAAQVLAAALASPIHYAEFNNPPSYVSAPNAEQVFVEAAAERGVRTRVLTPGAELELHASP